MLKVFQYGLLRQGGIMVEPSQVGLKSDPFAQYQGIGNSFSSYLGVAGSTNLNVPTPPTPPEDNSNPDAVARFNQEMIAYTQQMQAYNQNMMRMMMQQFQLMQQRIQSLNTTQSQNASSIGNGVGTLGIGGILDGASDLDI
ncbi:MAG: hypothetical protein VKJ04_07050 [Vampirovibrionales bacterium]|nr:hypothetical protein [Vampirovibrionales bacterium]